MGMKGQLIVAQATPINPISKSSSSFTFQFAGSKPILFNMPGSAARISIVDIQGRTVWSTVQKSGVQNLTWNRKSSDGSDVAAGNYFVQLTALDASQKPVGQITSTAIQVR
jgi:flagellar hook assembly protein FlgD